MSVAARPFADPRNTYIVDNNDPEAFDKTHRGTPGTHTEQRCCGDRAPYMAPMFYSMTRHETIAETLWCHECETAAEQGWADFIETLSEGAPVIRGIAMAVSYIPVFGTAVSFLLNTALTLAEGGDIDESVLDGLGGALPGQPASRIAFNAARSILKGDRIDKIAIQALPLDPSAIKAITTAVSIVEDIASGEKLTDIALNQLFAQLPPEGQRAMTLARRLAQGENVSDDFFAELEMRNAGAMREAASYARSQGEDAVGRFIAESGYQGTMDTITPIVRDALTAGIAAGLIERRRWAIIVANIQTFATTEQNVTTNDGYAEKGRKTINSGAKWKGRLLSDIRDGSSFTITHDVFNALRQETERRKQTYEIDDRWRRGFEIAIGLCEGSSVDGPRQEKVRASLVSVAAGHGFVAGQEIQFDRANPLRTLVKLAVPSAIQTLALDKAKAISKTISAASASGVQVLALDNVNTVSQSVSAVSAAEHTH